MCDMKACACQMAVKGGKGGRRYGLGDERMCGIGS